MIVPNRWNAAEVFWWTLTIRGNSSSFLEGHRSIVHLSWCSLQLENLLQDWERVSNPSVPLSGFGCPVMCTINELFFSDKSVFPTLIRSLQVDVMMIFRKNWIENAKVSRCNEKNLYSYLVGWKPFLHFLLKLNPQRWTRRKWMCKKEVFFGRWRQLGESLFVIFCVGRFSGRRWEHQRIQRDGSVTAAVDSMYNWMLARYFLSFWG